MGGMVAVAASSPLPTRYARFAIERFAPVLHLPLVSVLVGSVYMASAGANGADPKPWPAVVSGGVALLALFAMRAADDAKDADADRRGRPERPVPAGLVTVDELRRLAAGCLIAGGVLGLILPLPAPWIYLLAASFLWLAGRDFFVPERAHRTIVVYALVHAPTLPLVASVIWWSNQGARGGAPFAAMLCMVAGTSLVLEVVRKTVDARAERPHVETYSASLGTAGAIHFAERGLAVAVAGAASYGLALGLAWWAVCAPLAIGLLSLVLCFPARPSTLPRARPVLAAASMLVLAWPAVLAVL